MKITILRTIATLAARIAASANKAIAAHDAPVFTVTIDQEEREAEYKRVTNTDAFSHLKLQAAALRAES